MAGVRDVVGEAAMTQAVSPRFSPRVTAQPMSQLTPEMVQAIIASQAQPVMMQPGFGANRFLTGPAPIPMTFGVDVPAYNSMQMQPGDFASFLAAQRRRSKMIPVFDASSGTYQSVAAPK